MNFAKHLHVRGYLCVLIILLIYTSYVHGSNEIETSYENGSKVLRDVGKGTNGNSIKGQKRSTVNSTSVGLWFGPRLGKRRKSADRSEIEPEDVEAIAEALNTGPWAFVSIPRARRTEYSRRQVTQLTARPAEEAMLHDAWDKQFDHDQGLHSSREFAVLSPVLQSLLRKALI